MPTAKTTRPRKTAASAPDEEAPLVDLTEDPFDPTKVKRRFLFQLNGTKYYIPDAVPAGVLHKVVSLQEEKGNGAAMWWLFGEFFGEDGVEALRAYKGLTRAHLNKLYAACSDVLTGPKEA